MSPDLIINILLGIATIAVGLVLFYEAYTYYQHRNAKPEVKNKLIAAIVLSVIAACLAVGFGIWHFFLHDNESTANAKITKG